MRKLATIRRIDNITPIEDADKIQLAHIGGWKVVIAKNANHNIGDIVVYCEIDSFLPIEPELEFLRKTSYKKMGDLEGFRLKTIKLRNQISQGLIIPLKDAITIIKRNYPNTDINLIEGMNVTDLLGIQKYDPPIPAYLSGTVKGQFPSFIQKTEEERIQNLANEYDEWKNSNIHFYITEKLDGSSATFYLKDDEFGVCTRNLELKETQENTLWKVARDLKIEEKLRKYGKNIALQGELIGEGIQKNLYKIKGQTVRFFNVFIIDEYRKADYAEFTDFIHNMGLETVPIVSYPSIGLPPSVESMLNMADGSSILNMSQNREGVVVRSIDSKISFKAISNKFLLKK